MLVLLPFIVVPFFFGERGGVIGYRILAFWSRIFSLMNFIPFRVRGTEHVQKGKSYVYLSNHTSYLDIPALLLAIPSQFRPLAKKELTKIPVLGWIINAASVIVDRSSGESRVRSMKHMKEVLARGISILIFPEGTQNRTADPLQPFYDGAFRIAIDMQQDIVPVVIKNAGNLMKPGQIRIRRGTVTTVLCAPVSTAGKTHADIPSIKEAIRKEMLEVLSA
jgi:1-acyl-sn-glycerol-3-phosphate acyltransferase